MGISSSMTPNKSDSGELREKLQRITYAYRLDNSLWAFDPEGLIATVTAHIQAVEDKAFKEGQRVGQYQAADRLYTHVTTMWTFRDGSIPELSLPDLATDMLKDCEKYLNHNRKTYTEYLKGERYQRLAQYLGEKQDDWHKHPAIN